MNKSIKYVEFQKNGTPSTNFKIKTDITDTVAGAKTSCVIGNVEGLFTPGENVSDPVQRSYSDGVVFDPNPIFSNKSISVEIMFYSNSNSSLKTNYNEFLTFLKNNGSNLKLITDFPTNNTVQFQRLQWEKDSWKEKGGGFIIVTAYFASKEAW